MNGQNKGPGDKRGVPSSARTERRPSSTAAKTHLVSLVTMFAGGFTFPTSLQHSFGFWASYSAQLLQRWPRGGSPQSSPSPGPTVSPPQCQGCAAAVLRSLQATQGEKITHARGWWDAQLSRSSCSTMPCPDLPRLGCSLQPPAHLRGPLPAVRHGHVG